MSENIRPHKVVQAANWLLKNGSLYKDEGNTLNENWLENFSIGTNVSVVNETDNDEQCVSNEFDNEKKKIKT